MNKCAIAMSALFLPVSLMAQQFVPAPPIPPTRGVVAPLIQLPPNAAMEMFVANLREALQGGSVPDISLFQQLAAVHDQRYYDFYPEVVRMASTVYRDMVYRYLSVLVEHHRLPPAQITPMDELARNTHHQAMVMVEQARIAAHNKNAAARTRYSNAIKFLRDQVISYKGNPATLTMPLLIIPRVAPGDVASHIGGPSIADLEIMANDQLRAAGDRLGSGSARSNQWLQLVREYRQAVINKDATFRSFNQPSEYLLDSVFR